MKSLILSCLLLVCAAAQANDLICQGQMGPASYVVQVGSFSGNQQFVQITGYLKSGTTPPQILAGSLVASFGEPHVGQAVVYNGHNMKVMAITNPTIKATTGQVDAILTNGSELHLKLVCNDALLQFNNPNTPPASQTANFMGCAPCGSMNGGCVCKRF